MEITYDYYRVFYYVARYKSFSKAAKALFSNQPNVTHFMNNLENQLGCKLFIRSNRGVTLTTEGQKLYQHVSIAYQHLRAAELELANDQTMESGSVTISASEIALHLLLLPVLGKFRKQYPGIRLRILNHSTPQAVQAVKEGLADFAVVTTPLNAKKPLKITTLMEFQEILVGNESFEGMEEPIHLSECTDYPLISLGKESMTYEFYTKFFLENNLVFASDTEVATIDQILPMIVNNLGIGFIPESLAKNVMGKEKVFQIPLVEQIPKREICLIENKNFPPGIAAETLKKML